MSEAPLTNREYKYGFYTDIETEEFPKGLSESIIRKISAIKEEPDFILDFRLKAFRHWITLEEPKWANVRYPKIDFQDLKYYSAPNKKPQLSSLEEEDPDI